MTKKQHYMRYDERIRLEEKLRYKVPVAQIARELGFSQRTIYNEIKRGRYLHTCDYWDEWRYSAEKGQAIQDRNRQNKGRGLKIGKDRALAAFLEDKMLREKCSPAVALELARREGFQTSICVQTLYNYIDGGLFIELTNAHLLVKRHAKCNFVRNSDFPSIPCASKRSYQFLLRTQNVTFAGKTEYCGHKENRLKTPQALLNQGLRGF